MRMVKSWIVVSRRLRNWPGNVEVETVVALKGEKTHGGTPTPLGELSRSCVVCVAAKYQSSQVGDLHPTDNNKSLITTVVVFCCILQILFIPETDQNPEIVFSTGVVFYVLI